MSKQKDATESVPVHMIELMAKAGLKKPRVDAIELLDLLTDLSEVELPLPLLQRVRALQDALSTQSWGGAKGAEASKETRRGPRSKRAAILAAAAKYGTPNSAQVAAIARSSGSTVRYVRTVLGLKKTEM